MKYIDGFFNLLMGIFMVISKILLVVMTCIICTSVFFRYVLNTGLSWTDEVSMLFMVWFGFISVSYGVKEDLHIGVELFYNMFPKKLQWVCRKFNHIVIFTLGCILAYYSYALMQTTMTNYMTATRWPTAVRYAPVGVCGVFMAFYSFRHLISKEKKVDDEEKEGATTLSTMEEETAKEKKEKKQKEKEEKQKEKQEKKEKAKKEKEDKS